MSRTALTVVVLAAPGLVAAPCAGAPTKLLSQPDGSRLAVTLVKVVDGARPGRALERANFGSRYLVAELRIENVGEAAFVAPPDPGARLVTSGRRAFPPWPVDLVQPALAGVRVDPGDEEVVNVTFQVPAGLRPGFLRLRLTRGGQAAAWRLLGGRVRVVPVRDVPRAQAVQPEPEEQVSEATTAGAPAPPAAEGPERPAPEPPGPAPAEPATAPAPFAVPEAGLWRPSCHPVAQSPYAPLTCAPRGGAGVPRLRT